MTAVLESPLTRIAMRLEGESIEVYSVEGNSIRIAERHRMHLMDSGVSVIVSDQKCAIRFTLCSQRSNAASLSEAQHFERVDTAFAALEHGDFIEISRRTQEVENPSAPGQVLDVWYEVSYQREYSENELVAGIRWALAFEKYLR